jgi:hypothetical protein
VGGITWGCGGTGAKKTFPGAVRWRDSRENAEGDGCSSVNAAATAGVVDFLFCLRTRTMFINIVFGTRIGLLHAGPPPSSMSSRF